MADDQQVVHNPIKSLSKAIAYATDKHKYQRRKSDHTPYITHPVRVMEILVDHGIVDSITLQVAVLHDVVEDTDATLSDIRERFGPIVSSIVNEVSDDKFVPKADRKRMQITKVQEGSYWCKVVKMADKVDNCRDIVRIGPPVHWTGEYTQGYIAWCFCVVEVARDACPSLAKTFENDVLNERFTPPQCGGGKLDCRAWNTPDELVELVDKFYELC